MGDLRRLALLGLLFFPLVHANEADSIPDPLTLEQAVQLIDAEHPELLQQKLATVRTQAEQDVADNQQNLNVSLLGRLRWFEPRNGINVDDHDDHALRLVVSKSLYDGGKAEAQRQSALMSEQSADLQYADATDLYRISVMRKFFDIILSDHAAAGANESMATAFVRFDRAQDHLELGKISDIDLLRIEDTYQTARLKLIESEGKARRTRQALALALNRPSQQPSELARPELDVNDRVLPEFDVLLESVLKGNRQLAALDKAMDAARVKVRQARSGFRPNVKAQVERSDYSRSLSSADRWRAGIEFSIPLYDGGQEDAAIRKAQIDVNELMYKRQQHQLELRAQVRELYERFNLLNAERQASDVFSDYRGLYMDRSRALYELEVKTDLGDAMVEISASQLRDAKQRFQMTLLIAQLNLLAGKDVMQWDALAKKKPPQPDAG